MLFSDATTHKNELERNGTIELWKKSGAYIYVKGWDARNELEDKERGADGGWQKTYVMTTGRDSSSRWTNLMELKAFDRQVYST